MSCSWTNRKWYQINKHNLSDEEHISFGDMIAEIYDKQDGMDQTTVKRIVFEGTLVTSCVIENASHYNGMSDDAIVNSVSTSRGSYNSFVFVITRN